MANIFKSKYTGEQIEEILDKANNVTDITPNPEAEATDELHKITIGNNTFSIPNGVTVEANPSADATEELTKLKVGDTVFSIPQGSGQSSLGFVTITGTAVAPDYEFIQTFPLNLITNSMSEADKIKIAVRCISVCSIGANTYFIQQTNTAPYFKYRSVDSSTWTNGNSSSYDASTNTVWLRFTSHSGGVN